MQNKPHMLGLLLPFGLGWRPNSSQRVGNGLHLFIFNFILINRFARPPSHDCRNLSPCGDHYINSITAPLMNMSYHKICSGWTSRCFRSYLSISLSWIPVAWTSQSTSDTWLTFQTESKEAGKKNKSYKNINRKQTETENTMIQVLHLPGKPLN